MNDQEPQTIEEWKQAYFKMKDSRERAEADRDRLRAVVTLYQATHDKDCDCYLCYRARAALEGKP